MEVRSSLTKEVFYSQHWSVGLPDERLVRELLRVARKIRAEVLLDVGCGDGSLTVLVQRTVGASTVWGVDISEEAIAKAAERGIRGCVLDIDERELPFPNEFFDAVLAGAIIEHLVNPDRILAEIHRVMRISGHALVYAPNLASWYNRLLLLLGFQPQVTEASLRIPDAGKILKTTPPGGGGHLRVITLRAFRELLEAHGFKVLEVRGVAPPTAPLPKVLRPVFASLNAILCRFPSLASSMIALVTK